MEQTIRHKEMKHYSYKYIALKIICHLNAQFHQNECEGHCEFTLFVNKKNNTNTFTLHRLLHSI